MCSCFHVEREGQIAGFMGLAYQKIEMLFIDPNFLIKASVQCSFKKL